MIWFGRLSAISQLASRVGGGGGVGQNPLHIITLPGSGRVAGRGVAFPPLATVLPECVTGKAARGP
jgi:hypothetical protein